MSWNLATAAAPQVASTNDAVFEHHEREVLMNLKLNAPSLRE